MSTQQFAELIIFGKAAQRFLGEYELSVNRNFESAGAARDQGDIAPRFADNPVPHPEGARLVVSRLAIFDFDLHRCLPLFIGFPEALALVCCPRALAYHPRRNTLTPSAPVPSTLRSARVRAQIGPWRQPQARSRARWRKGKRLNTVRLQRVAKAFWESAALMSAVELGLFTAISSGHDTVAAAAVEMDIEPVNAERLMTALTAMTLLERAGDRFSRTRLTWSDSWSRGKRTFAGPWMLFSKPRWESWGRLTEYLRHPVGDQRVLGMYDESFTEEKARAYHEATYSIGMGAARHFHRQVDLTGRRRIMDLGGGSGCYCIVAAEKYPDLSAVVLDLAPVVKVTREFLDQHGVTDRVTAQACDFTRDPLPSDADVAIMASNLPQYSGEDRHPRGRSGARSAASRGRIPSDRGDGARRPPRALSACPMGFERGSKLVDRIGAFGG